MEVTNSYLFGKMPDILILYYWLEMRINELNFICYDYDQGFVFL